MKAAKYVVLALVAVLALGGVLSDAAYARQRKPHHGKYSHYAPGKNAELVGGKHKAPKKQKLPKHSYHAH